MNDNKPLNSFANDNKLKVTLVNPKHWIRLLLMGLMFIILFYLIHFITTITMLVQWLMVLLTGETNQRLQSFTKGLNRYAYQILEFINFNSETRPFPLSDWPESR